MISKLQIERDFIFQQRQTEASNQRALLPHRWAVQNPLPLLSYGGTTPNQWFLRIRGSITLEGAHSEHCGASREAPRRIQGGRLRPRTGRKGTTTRELPRGGEEATDGGRPIRRCDVGGDGSNQRRDAATATQPITPD